ncbi:MAG: hypothetical protein M1830_003428 [Pleopsidium flavum]|nr:MAG: hypothetical protein M1830_003428 [Pleopsidium flavum]
MSSSAGFIHYGVGGAGNYRKVEPSSPAAARPSVPMMPRAAEPFSSGIGGAGNIHHPSERAVISFDEGLVRSRARENSSPTPYFVGVGGAGNRRGRRQSSAASPSTSPGSPYSKHPLPIGGADMLWKKISKVFTLTGPS